jgi:ubiquinone/menaquinone biosynthesis C-methylase UbiE
MDAQVSGSQDFSKYYDGFLGGRFFRWLDGAKRRVLRKHLAALPPTAEVLDLGCGLASVTGTLVKDYPQLRLTAADHDARSLGWVRETGLNTQLLDFDQPLPFVDNRFDAVLMIDSIEHVASREGVLREVTRILRSEGSLVVFTPPYDTLAWLVGEKCHRLLTRRNAGHISPFTRESLAWVLDRWFVQTRVFYLNLGLTLCGIGGSKRCGARNDW